MSATEDIQQHHDDNDDTLSDMLRSPVELCCDESFVEEQPTEAVEWPSIPEAEPIIVHYVSGDEDDGDDDDDECYNTDCSTMQVETTRNNVKPPSTGPLAVNPLPDDASAEAVFQYLINYTIHAYRVSQRANGQEEYVVARQRCLNLSSHFLELAEACARQVAEMDESHQRLTAGSLTQPPPPSQKPAHQQAKRPRSARLAARSARRLPFF